MEDKLLFGESKYVEYKRNYSKTLLKTVSAYANFNDGHILIGLEDDGRIVGVEHPDEVRLSIENAINDSVNPRPYYEINEVVLEDKSVIVLAVFKGDHTPYTVDNKAYKRMDTSSVPADRNAYEELILLGRNLSFETLPSTNQKLSFRELEERMERILNVKTFSDDLLISLGLKRNDRFNNAAALLSDLNPLDSSTIQLIAYKSDNVLQILDRQKLENTSVLRQYDMCMDFYRKHINVSELIEGPYRETVEEIPLVAYREAVANAIVHRDYSRQVDLRIECFSNRIEIVSPGGLPVGIRESEYLEGRISVPRNRVLADVFLRLNIIEKLATGIRRIKEYYQDYEMKPQFEIYENSIVVILPKISLPGDSVYRPIGLDQYQLNDNERLIYKTLEERGALSRSEIQEEIGLKKSQTIDLLQVLRELKLVSQIGRGRTTKYSLTKRGRTK